MDALLVQMGSSFESGAILLALPVLWFFFFTAFALRWLMHRKVRAQYRFLAEFERRVHRRFSDPQRSRTAFGPLVGQMFETVLDEHYSSKKGADEGTKPALKGAAAKTREASVVLAREASKEVSQWRHTMESPRFQETARFVLGASPAVATVGRYSVGGIHRVINALPAIFLFLGSALTILGIVSAGMPALGILDATRVEDTARALRALLGHLPYTLLFAASGIVQAACLQMANALLDPERVFHSAANKLAGALSILWQDTAPASASEAEPLPVPAAMHLADHVEDVTPPAPSPPPIEVTKQSPVIYEPPSPAFVPQRPAPAERVAKEKPVREKSAKAKQREAPRSIDPEEATFVGEISQMPAPPDPNVLTAVDHLPPPPAQEEAVNAWGLPPAPTVHDETPQDVPNAAMPVAGYGSVTEIPHPVSVPHEPMTVVHDFSRGANVNDMPSPETPATALWGGGTEGAIHDDRLAVLKHRIGVIEQYLEKAAEDRMHGLISEEMWQEESTKWAAERDRLVREVAALENRSAA